MATNEARANQSAAVEETEEERRRRQIEKNQPVIALLRSWRETTDPDEIRDQKETWEILERAFAEERRADCECSSEVHPDGVQMATKLGQMDEAHVTTDGIEEERRRLPVENNQRLTTLLDSWLSEDDPEELQDQRETWEFLKQALDEDRLSYRKLFP